MDCIHTTRLSPFSLDACIIIKISVNGVWKSTAIFYGTIRTMCAHILHSLGCRSEALDPQVSAMCNLGVNLCLAGLPVPAFEYWWRGLQLSPTNWDILVGLFLTIQIFH